MRYLSGINAFGSIYSDFQKDNYDNDGEGTSEWCNRNYPYIHGEDGFGTGVNKNNILCRTRKWNWALPNTWFGKSARGLPDPIADVITEGGQLTKREAEAELKRRAEEARKKREAAAAGGGGTDTGGGTGTKSLLGSSGSSSLPIILGLGAVAAVFLLKKRR